MDFFTNAIRGWCLSPAYDVNSDPPVIKARLLSTCIDFGDLIAAIDLALSVIGDFLIEKTRVAEIIKEVAQAVSEWRTVAA